MNSTFNILTILALFGTIESGQAQQTLTTKELAGQRNVVTTAVPLLLIAPDTRGGSLGDAGVASTPDANSIHWNPAKLAFITKDNGYAVSYTPWLRALVNDINLGYLTGFKKVGKDQALGMSLLYFSLGNIVFTDIMGNVTGDFNPHEFALDAAYSRKLSDNFSGGLALRYIYSNLSGNIYLAQGGALTRPGQSVAADLSVYYQRKILLSGKNGLFASGLNISNIGSKISYTDSGERNFIPINMRLGPSLSVDLDQFNSMMFVVDFNKLLVPSPDPNDTDQAWMKKPIVDGMLGSFSDAPGGFREELNEVTLSVGAEYWYDRQFALRAGYFYEDDNKGARQFFTIGAGLKYNVFGLDFGYLIPTEQKHPLENTLRFTLNFDL
ncbi:MAG: type IX secretion system outer membrane channel protein PorV [Bacteroidetes bacterium]|nr:type IX secretion system outer membrane channel protein PorV [Bacteroidota bacterium]